MPFLWEYRGRVLLALLSLVLSKFALVAVPLVVKMIIDHFEQGGQDAMIVLPLSLVLLYGLLRLLGSLFNELRDAVFTRVRYHAMRRLSAGVLTHLHQLSLGYHLSRQTGGISRDLDRGARSASSILNYLVFNIVPTAVEFILVAALLLMLYDVTFFLIIFASIAVYFLFTFLVSEWRMDFRHEMNRLDSTANNQAFDSLINYETVKYFGNEDLEVARYNNTLREWEEWGVKTQSSMSLLNFGQSVIITLGVTLVTWYAVLGVANASMQISDLVLVTTLMIQMFIPLGFLGIVYRQVKNALADMQRLTSVMALQPDIQDASNAPPLVLRAGHVRFEKVDFGYQSDRQILHDVSFTIAPGEKVAVVGHSGAGKSTLSRLLYRFYEPDSGQILIDDQPLHTVTQASLRAVIGIVPQDTVLFNESIYYNLSYGRPSATRDEVIAATKMAHIHDFIESLPQSWETVVGERGLKLSGGEKQRIAIARAMLKRPAILIFDEATSSLDSATEQAIQETLKEVAKNHTTMVIAHRLSTIVDADRILVLDKGRIIEQGSHQQLLANRGSYARMWELQQHEDSRTQEVFSHVH
jgi:ATP-binding cassette subfamily B protein